MRIVLTGGMGYIGSHVALDLARAGHDVTILDNFSNSSPLAFAGIMMLAGRKLSARLNMVRLDVRDTSNCTRLFGDLKPEAVIHLAGLKDVAQSVRDPVRYFDVNMIGTRSLLQAMQCAGCERLIFSSSAAIYGDPEYLPVDERHPCFPGSPYGHSKHAAEMLIRRWVTEGTRRRALALRYFNPVGCEFDRLRGVSLSSGGDALMNRLVAVASGNADHLKVYGSDYDTPDGSGLRDYVHVSDLARAHVDALSTMKNGNAGFMPVNLGTGHAVTVRQMVAIFETCTGCEVPTRATKRRGGDIAASWAAVDRARVLMGWRATRTHEEMCLSAWSARGFDLSACNAHIIQNRSGTEYSTAR